MYVYTGIRICRFYHGSIFDADAFSNKIEIY